MNMSDNDKDLDLNQGVQIILNRMKTNPEEFFDNGSKWAWIFKGTLREVLTEIEKAALFEGLKTVRRMEITAKAAATVLKSDEREKEGVGVAMDYTEPKKLVIDRAHAEMIKRMASK